MTRAEIIFHNAGIAAVAALAAASADAMRTRLVQRPTRYVFAIAALEAVVEGAAEMMLPLPPDGEAGRCDDRTSIHDTDHQCRLFWRQNDRA